MSGASGRVWATNDGRGRLELQSNAGDVQIVWNQQEVTVFDASSNTVYRATLPARSGTDSNNTAETGVPAVDEIAGFLGRLGAHVDLSGAQPSNVGGQPAYTVRISPKHDGGLLGAAELAWDAARPVPLRIGIYAQGASSPVLELTATQISYGPVPTSDVATTPPSSAKVIDLGGLTKGSGAETAPANSQVTGLQAVQQAVSFGVVAPPTLVGLPRQDVRLVGKGDSQTVVAVYGQGLGAIVVVERTPPGSAGPLGALPQVSLDGVTAHELATQLGTALTWKRGGVSFVLAGSVPPAAAEAAARALK
jgi:outer membrane lipoprotein-sorting protein